MFTLILDLKFTLRLGFTGNGPDLTFTLRLLPTLFPFPSRKTENKTKFYFWS